MTRWNRTFVCKMASSSTQSKVGEHRGRQSSKTTTALAKLDPSKGPGEKRFHDIPSSPEPGEKHIRYDSSAQVAQSSRAFPKHFYDGSAPGTELFLPYVDQIVSAEFLELLEARLQYESMQIDESAQFAEQVALDRDLALGLAEAPSVSGTSSIHVG